MNGSSSASTPGPNFLFDQVDLELFPTVSMLGLDFYFMDFYFIHGQGYAIFTEYITIAYSLTSFVYSTYVYNISRMNSPHNEVFRKNTDSVERGLCSMQRTETKGMRRRLLGNKQFNEM